MANGIKIAIHTKELEQLLKKIQINSKSTKKYYTWAWALMFKEIMHNFSRSGSKGDILSKRPSKVFVKWTRLGGLQKSRRAAKGTGSKPLMDSNRLRLSIATTRIITNKKAEIGTDAPHGAALHFGVTIVPKRAQFLTLPFPGIEGRARDYDNTFIAKGVIFQNVSGGIRPLFILKKKVVIPPRPYITIGSDVVDKIVNMASRLATGGNLSVGGR